MGKRAHKTRQILRDYAGDLQSQDLTRLFSRDAAQAYSVLTRDQDPTLKHGALARIKRLFLGMSFHLGPARRVLFCTTMIFTFLGLFEWTINLLPGFPSIDSQPTFHLLAILGLAFLLALELVDRVKIRDELEIARQLQREILPHEAPPTPGYAFAHSYTTAQAIGGDYYDFIPTSDGRLVLIAGDASGHGIAAGLLMVIASSTLKLAIDGDPEPSKVVGLLNRALCGTGGSRAFMTLFYGLLEPTTGHLDYICAGHPFPLLRRTGGRIEELGTGSLPLGLRPQESWATESARLNRGDMLLLYSDGFPESVRSSGESFGFERLRTLMAPGGSPSEIHRRIVDDHSRFLGDEDPLDDVSLVVVGHRPEAATEEALPTVREVARQAS
ncbi:MAG: PP2C family protein-serine/threonine phosphatase [Thermoanaerobaculia bacterium]|nr:PP2C family protein-serine/threonine phosphatase [Thermoanaerobaculia bacterium]